MGPRVGPGLSEFPALSVVESRACGSMVATTGDVPAGGVEACRDEDCASAWDEFYMERSALTMILSHEIQEESLRTFFTYSQACEKSEGSLP